jgi:hypothetical protein
MAATVRGGRSIQSTVRWTLGMCAMVYVYIFSRLLLRSPTTIPNNAGELENALGAFRYKNIRAHPLQVKVLQDGRREFETLATGSATDTDTERTRNHLGLLDADAIDDSSNQNHRRQKLQDKLDNVYISTGHSYDGDLWELSDYVPHWMKGKVPYCG